MAALYVEPTDVEILPLFVPPVTGLGLRQRGQHSDSPAGAVRSSPRPGLPSIAGWR